MSIRAYFAANDVGDDTYHSDGGDAVAQQRALTKRKSLSGHGVDSSSLVKKSRHRTTDVFVERVKEDVGLVILPADKTEKGRAKSKCSHCGTTMVNILDRWQRHAKACAGFCNRAEATRLINYVHSATESHRKILCDTYAIVFWTYKHKLPFTMGAKEKEVSKIFMYDYYKRNNNYKHNNNNIILPHNIIMLYIATVGIKLRRPKVCAGAGPVQANGCKVC